MPTLDLTGYTEREAHLMSMCHSLFMALRDLVEQVDSLEGYQLTRDVEPYKAQACWDYALENAHEALAGKGKTDA